MSVVDYRKGDYRAVADRLRPAAVQLVEAAGVRGGDLVVDVAAGSGNVSRLCAERGAHAVAVDIVREQLLLGRADGTAAISWVQGDAQALPVRSGVADAVLSTFGVIFAPRTEQAVAELGRVCRPGGTIGVATWPSGEWQEGQSRLVLDAIGQPADSTDHASRWGTADGVRALLSAVADDVEVTAGALVDRYASVEDWWEKRSATAPLLGTARETLSPDRYADLGRALRALAMEHFASGDDGFVIRDDFLVAVARRR